MVFYNAQLKGGECDNEIRKRHAEREILNRSIHGVFLRNRLYLGRTGVTSFRMQFKKVGRGLLWKAKQREWAVLAKAKGDKNKISVQ